MIKEYKISYNDFISAVLMECELRIDHSIADPKIKETLEFFAGTKYLIRELGEKKAFLTILTRQLIWIGMELEFKLDSSIDKIREKIQDTEGWCYVCPEFGITITSWSFGIEIYDGDMQIEEIGDPNEKEVPNA